MTKERFCYLCEKAIFYDAALRLYIYEHPFQLKDNEDYKQYVKKYWKAFYNREEEFNAIWESEHVELFCCNCYEEMPG